MAHHHLSSESSLSSFNHHILNHHHTRQHQHQHHHHSPHHHQSISLSPLTTSKFFGDPCPFCLELMNCSCGSKAIVKLNPCKHQAHEVCFREWIRSKNTCPYCRSVIDTYIHLSPESSGDSTVYFKVNFLATDGDSTVNDDLDLLNFSPLDYPWFPRWTGQGFKMRFRSMFQWFRPQQQQQQQQQVTNNISNALHF